MLFKFVISRQICTGFNESKHCKLQKFGNNQRIRRENAGTLTIHIFDDQIEKNLKNNGEIHSQNKQQKLLQMVPSTHEQNNRLFSLDLF